MTDPRQLQKQSGQIHEGDPFGGIKNPASSQAPEPREVNYFHTRSDLNRDQKAQHHTLGIEHNEASPGDHVHDGISSRKIGTGLNLTVETGVSTAADLSALFAMLHEIIDFDET